MSKEEQALEKSNNGLQLNKELYKNTLDALKGLEKLDDSMEITSEYLKLEEGEQQRFVYMGMTRLTSQYATEDPEGKVDAVKLMGSDQKIYIAADAVIVSSLSECTPPCPVAITNIGEEKGKNGTYKTFKISLLV